MFARSLAGAIMAATCATAMSMCATQRETHPSYGTGSPLPLDASGAAQPKVSKRRARRQKARDAGQK